MGARANITDEPEVEELLSDPVLHAVLKSDGITVDDVKKVIHSYQNSKSITCSNPK